MHVLKTDFNGNPNVGLYAYCTNRYCLLGTEVSSEKAKMLSEVLKVPVHQMSICGTSLLGVFLAGNSRMLLVPDISFENELKTLDSLGIKYAKIHTNMTALGNNILCNDRGCIVNPDFSAQEKKKIGEALGLDVAAFRIAGLDVVGGIAAMNSKGCLIHRDISREEQKKAEKALGVKCHPSSVNMGSPHIHSGIICNDNGFAIGELSGGPEMVNADEVLGFLIQDLQEAREGTEPDDGQQLPDAGKKSAGKPAKKAKKTTATELKKRKSQ
jgi:translation initiation factor 6